MISLNLLATLNKQSNPSVSNAFDIDLPTGSLVSLDSKILVDFKLVLPSKGNEEDEHCLLLFFHIQNKKWEDDKLTASRRFMPTIMSTGSRKGISEIDQDNEDLTGSSNNLAAEDLGCIKVDDPLNGDDHGIESQDCEETTESQKPENTPRIVEFRFDKQFISRVLYEEAIMTAVKKDITKLLKLCHLESTGNLASTRTRLLDYVDYSLKEGGKIPDENILSIVKSINANSINMELTRLNLDTKGQLKSKKEALIKYLKCDKGNKNVETHPPSLQPKDDNTKVKKAETSKEVIKGKDTTETYSVDELNKRKLAIFESSLIAIQKNLEAQRTAFDLILRDENQKNTKNKRTCNCKCQEEVKNLQKEFGNLKRDTIIPCSSREIQPQPITEQDSGTQTNPIEDLRQVESVLLSKISMQDEIIAQQSAKIEQLHQIHEVYKRRYNSIARHILRERSNIITADLNYSSTTHQQNLTALTQTSKESIPTTSKVQPIDKNILHENHIPYIFELTMTTSTPTAINKFN